MKEIIFLGNTTMCGHAIKVQLSSSWDGKYIFAGFSMENQEIRAIRHLLQEAYNYNEESYKPIPEGATYVAVILPPDMMKTLLIKVREQFYAFLQETEERIQATLKFISELEA